MSRSPPPSLGSPPPKAAPRPPPKQILRPKVAPRPTSPSQRQQLGVVLATPTEDAKATPTGRPSRPLLPPKKKLQKVQSVVESNLERVCFQEPKKVPPRLCPKPQASPDPLSCPDRRYSMNQDSLFNLNGYTKDKNCYESSLPVQSLHASKPPKPLAPPPVKPRKPRSSSAKKQDNKIK